MERAIERTLLAFAAGLAFVLPVTAQPASPPTPQAGSGVRVSKLIGMDVRDASAKKLGDVKDLVIDTNSGTVHYAVLSLGGVLGIGDKRFAVPLAKVRVDGKGRLVLDTTKEQLEAAPSFDDRRWPDWNAGAYRADLDRAYGAAKDARFRRASDLLKAQVRDANGGNIGDIEDIVVDLAHSRVHYVVVEFDRAWNPNDKLVALPMSTLRAVATAPAPAHNADSAAPPRNPPPVLALQNPGGPSKGPASATIPPGGVQTRPPAMDPREVTAIPKPALPTMSSYADDEDLVYAGTREALEHAPAFDKGRYPDLRDAARRADFDRRLAR